MSQISDFADTYHRYRQSTDHHRLIWVGDLDQIEHWEDITPDGLRTRIDELRDFADRADRLQLGDAREKALAETISFTARSEANQLIWRSELEFPNPAIGLIPRILTFLPRYSLISEDHGTRYQKKLRSLPAFLERAGAAVRSDAGPLPLTRHLTETIAAIDAQLTRDDVSNPLLAQPAPTDTPVEYQDHWRRETARLVHDVVHPALARYRDSMAAAADFGRDDDRPGLCHLDGGAELYRDLVWSHTSLGLSGEEVHQIGLDQVDRLEEEYRSVAGPLLGTDDIGEIYARLRDDPELSYRDGAQLVADASRALERAAAAAPDWFGTLPQSPCVAEEIAQGALAFYSKPIPEVGKPGRFFFNTSDPSAWKTFQLEAVTFHESIPGHHLQLALVVESDDIHGVHTDLPVTVYSEGWGLYTERLADEMGLYSSEFDRIGMLAADSMRACRLVTDTGMHALGWSRARAIDYVLDHSPLTRRTAEGEIDRYIGLPGQALSYMIGRIEIDRIRREAEQRPDFEIKAFHDAVLENGMVPLGTLRSLVLD
ncbi:MAG: DUF885 domain-containing protein [Acidimicrobiia bacterium]|nr:DUF885 domain-containing protein [Acidimicrobiia bacterium]